MKAGQVMSWRSSRRRAGDPVLRVLVVWFALELVVGAALAYLRWGPM